MQYYSNKRAVFRLMFHIVLCTKYRRKVLSSRVMLDLKDIISPILKKNKISLVEFNGEKDHIHLLIDCQPTINLKKMINVIKTVSSREIRKKHNFKNSFYNKKVFWSPSYFIATCGGVTIEVLKKYVQEQ